MAYFLSQVSLLLQVNRRPEVLCGERRLLYERADPPHGFDKGAGFQASSQQVHIANNNLGWNLIS
jgi:hypothetical protein